VVDRRVSIKRYELKGSDIEKRLSTNLALRKIAFVEMLPFKTEYLFLTYNS